MWQYMNIFQLAFFIMTRLLIFIFFFWCVIAEFISDVISENLPEFAIFTAIFVASMLPLVSSKFFKKDSEEQANRNSKITTALSFVVISPLFVSFIIAVGYYDDLNMYTILQNGNKIEFLDAVTFSVSEALNLLKYWNLYCFVAVFWIFVFCGVDAVTGVISKDLVDGKLLNGCCKEYRAYGLSFSINVIVMMCGVAFFCNLFDDITERKVYRVDIQIDQELLPYLSEKCGDAGYIRYSKGELGCDSETLSDAYSATIDDIFENQFQKAEEVIEKLYLAQLHFVWDKDSAIANYSAFLSIPADNAPPSASPSEYLSAMNEFFSKAQNETKNIALKEREKEIYATEWNKMAIN